MSAAADAAVNGSELNGMDTAATLPFREILLQHINLSRKVSQALFASVQSSFSTALPPDPITRPKHLTAELANLPIWSLGPNAAPTVNELVPSLVAIHDSLDELLLKARTHRENVRKIKALKADVEQLQSLRRDRIKKLRGANVELREAVLRCGEAMSKVERARAAPLNYSDVLAYASDLARNTSAPPGWSGSNRLLSQQVKDAMKSEHVDADGVVQATPAAAAAFATTAESKDTPMSNKSTVAAADTPGAVDGVPAVPETPAHAADDQAENADRRPPTAHFTATNPEEAGPSATSAPHSLPFPSDADMRRGLMGVAMLEEQQQQQEQGGGQAGAGSAADFKSVVPTWRRWLEAQPAAETQQEAGAQQPTEQQQQAHQQQAPRGFREDAMVRDEDPDADAGFGLDLN